jgi:hypothetical protein
MGLIGAFDDQDDGVIGHHDLSFTIGKQRVRNNSHVTIAACTRWGRLTSDGADAEATVLPPSETLRVYHTRLKQHGVVGAALYRIFTRLGGGLDNRLVLEVSPPPATSS